jgi:hypothetical protein
MFNIIITNLIVIASAGLLMRYLFPFESIIDYLSAFFLLYFAQIVLSLELLGVLNILSLTNVILLNLVILSVIFVFIKRLKLMPVYGLKEKFERAVDSISLNRVQFFCLAAITAFAMVKVAINLVNPPFGWDNLNYHFPFPVEWLKHGNLDMSISISGDPSVSYYPINGSLFFLWFILPLKNVFLADLGQFPFFVIGFFATYALARKLNLSREYSFFSAAMFTLIPNYFKQLQIAYIDIMVAALFIIGLNYLFLLYKERSAKNAFFYSLAIGLMLGTKTTAMALAVILFLPFFGAFLRKSKMSSFILLFLLSVAVIVVTGGFSYIRNIIQTGNPLYPLDFKIFNTTIFKGVIDNATYRTGIRPGDFSLAKILFCEGLGAQTTLLFLPAVFLGLPLLLWKRRERLGFYLVYFFVLPFLFILIFRFVIPLPNLRYIYAVFAISSVIAFYTADMLNMPKIILRILVIICAVASMAELAKRFELIGSLVFTVVLFLILPGVWHFVKTRKLTKIILIGSVVFFLGLILLEKYYIKNEYRRYVSMVKYSGFWPDATKAWLWLNENTSGNNIAYIGRPVPFPLYGTGFKNNVYYVSVNTVEPAMLHYFSNSRYLWGYKGREVFRNFEDKNNYRGNADYNVWLRNLKNKNTDYLLIYSELLGRGIEFPLEDSWARSHEGSFKLVFSNDTIRIYKFNK